MKTSAESLQKQEYAGFYRTYLELAPFENLVELLTKDLYKQLDFLKTIPPEKLNYRYAPEKWTVADVVLHMTDTERILSYRALRFARNDKTELPGFDENAWVENSNSDRFSPEDLIGTFKTCRNHSIALFKSFDNSDLIKTGIASNSDFSVRALGYITIGHNRHHIEKIKSLYLR